MIEDIKLLLKKRSELTTNRSKLNDVINSVNLIKFDIDVSKVLEEKKIVDDQIDKLDDEIDEIQHNCQHKLPTGESAMRYTDHDSHYRYYKCSICNWENKV